MKRDETLGWDVRVGPASRRSFNVRVRASRSLLRWPVADVAEPFPLTVFLPSDRLPAANRQQRSQHLGLQTRLEAHPGTGDGHDRRVFVQTAHAVRLAEGEAHCREV